MKFSNLSKRFQRTDSILNPKYRYQLLATLTINIISFSHGIGLGWVSPTLTKLQSGVSPLDFEVGTNEASWIGSLLGLGSVLGTLVCGNLLDYVGRKRCIYMIAIPHICLWILIYSAQSVEFLYVGRFLGGATGGASYVVLPIFISEIADTRIRGTLASMLILSVNLGVLVGFIVSTHLSYHVVPFIIVLLPLIYLTAATRFPETPQHLLRQGRHFDAEKSYKFYKNCRHSITYNELQQCNEEFDELKTLITKGSNESPLSFQDFVTPTALKAFCTAAVLLLVNQFCGMFAFVNYMSHIFAASSVQLDPNTCTIIMGVVQIFASYAAVIFVDRCGRKIIMLLSTGGMAVGLTAFGLFTFYAETHNVLAFNWLPLVLMTFIVFVGNVGIVSLTFVLLVEILPAKIRSYAVTICIATLSFLVFVMLKIFPIYMETFGISITMWSCAAASGFAFLYLTIFLKETKGKSMDAE